MAVIERDIKRILKQRISFIIQ